MCQMYVPLCQVEQFADPYNSYLIHGFQHQKRFRTFQNVLECLSGSAFSFHIAMILMD